MKVRKQRRPTMKHALLALITTSALVLAGCSSGNDLTGPSTVSGPDTAAMGGGQSGAGSGANVESLTSGEMSAIVGTESNEWKKADVIFPRGTRVIFFHLDDPYA